jgi:hypothetical protein
MMGTAQRISGVTSVTSTRNGVPTGNKTREEKTMTKADTALHIIEAFSHWETVVLIFIIGGAIMSGPTTAQIWNRAQYFALAHPNSCNFDSYCVNHNATIASVRDYSVECDTWFSQGTCPREDLGVLTDAGNTFNATINCHYHTIGDPVSVIERFDYNPITNQTLASWHLNRGPC